MRQLCITIMLTAALAATARAQTGPAVLTVDEVREYVRLYEGEVERRGHRAESLTKQILDLDRDIEQRVDSVLKSLTGVRDSVDSKTRVTATKTDAIEALRKSIDYYVRERDKRLRDLASPYSRVAAEDNQGDVESLNRRIDKRIEQITALTSSFSQYSELDRYERYRDVDRDYNSKTPEARQQERVVSKAVNEKGKLVADLREAISALRRKNTSLQGSLRTAHTEEARKGIEEQIRANSDLIAQRQKQLDELVNAPESPSKPVSSEAAFELDRLLDDIVKEIRKDTVKLQVLVREREQALAALKPIKERLARAREKLAELAEAEGTSQPEE